MSPLFLPCYEAPDSAYDGTFTHMPPPESQAQWATLIQSPLLSSRIMGTDKGESDEVGDLCPEPNSSETWGFRRRGPDRKKHNSFLAVTPGKEPAFRELLFPKAHTIQQRNAGHHKEWACERRGNTRESSFVWRHPPVQGNVTDVIHSNPHLTLTTPWIA